MLNIKKIFDVSPFTKHVFTLMTGAIFAQAIPIAISPILARLYSPSDFGVLAIFVSITAIFTSVVTGKYENAILLPKNKEDAIALTQLSIIFSLVASVFIFIVICFLHDWIVTTLNEPRISIWLYIIPAVVFLVGVQVSLSHYFTREKKFSIIATSEVFKSVVLGSVQLFVGLLSTGILGLMLGRVTSVVVAPFYFWKKSSFNIFQLKKDSLLPLARRYVDFPKFIMWGGLFNSLATHLTQLVIPILYSTTTLGFFSLVFRILGIPFVFISNSVGQVFFEEAVRQKNEMNTALPIVKSLLVNLSLISFFGFGLSYFVLEDLFAFVFGEEWRIAGIYAKYLLPLFIVKFIVSPLTHIHSVFEKQKLSLLLQLLLLLLSLTVFVYAKLTGISVHNFLLTYSITLSLFYILRLLVILKIAANKF